MAGEMSRSDVTKEAYPLHFSIARSLRRKGYKEVSVRPFDVYQGPYVYVPGIGRIWVNLQDACPWLGHIYLEGDRYQGKQSPAFYLYSDIAGRIACRLTANLIKES